MSQWYAKFIKNYADICESLYNLKRKLKIFICSIEAQKAFDAVKAAITKAPVLKFPDLKKPFELFTDASSIGVGAVLNQEQKPVVFASRTLSATERNYTVRRYRHRKCDETEIGTGNSDNGSLHDESSGFDRVQRRSNESRDCKKKGVLPKYRKKSRREEMITPTTSGYNLRPRKGKREESRLTIERKTQEEGPVRSRKGRERNDSPYIEERTRSSNKNARRGGDQQGQYQERRGACTKKSLSLEVLVGNANYTSHKNQIVCIVSFYILSNKWSEEFCNKAKSRSDN
ncbi:retrovirus-related Pol polyprotein from transposon 297 [Trichonephila clavipes]|nr:retrovirus-related Pol polyprotein from transposon 297 [Trichonephila clavipes]